MAENVKARQKMERMIVRRIIREGRKDGYTFNVNNGGDNNELRHPVASVESILKVMFATSNEHLIFYKDGKKVGFVYLVYNNGNGGLDVISDYSTNLESVLLRVDKFIQQYS